MNTHVSHQKEETGNKGERGIINNVKFEKEVGNWDHKSGEETKMEESTYLTSGSTTKTQLSRKYGTGTKTEI